jgi:hypothetical protein
MVGSSLRLIKSAALLIKLAPETQDKLQQPHRNWLRLSEADVVILPAMLRLVALLAHTAGLCFKIGSNRHWHRSFR